MKVFAFALSTIYVLILLPCSHQESNFVHSFRDCQYSTRTTTQNGDQRCDVETVTDGKTFVKNIKVNGQYKNCVVGTDPVELENMIVLASGRIIEKEFLPEEDVSIKSLEDLRDECLAFRKMKMENQSKNSSRPLDLFVVTYNCVENFELPNPVERKSDQVSMIFGQQKAVESSIVSRSSTVKTLSKNDPSLSPLNDHFLSKRVLTESRKELKGIELRHDPQRRNEPCQLGEDIKKWVRLQNERKSLPSRPRVRMANGPGEIMAKRPRETISNEPINRSKSVRAMKMNHDKLAQMSDGSKIRKRRYIYPGTKWCGAGNVSAESQMLGVHDELDRCCEKHDKCPATIERLSYKYSYFNFGLYTISHCECDSSFRACLRYANSRESNDIGDLFFNKLSMKCFVLKKEKTCAERSWSGSCANYSSKVVAEARRNAPYDIN